MNEETRRVVAKLREAVERQAGLPDLLHFDSPSDFRKGVLSALAGFDAAVRELSDE